MMRTKVILFFIIGLCWTAGCETTRQLSKEAGTVVGKTMQSVGGITEGGAEAMKDEKPQDNPFNR